MKQKLYLALAFIMASFCSLQMQAERVAPTLPQGQTPQEGGCYWLYNVANELFIGEKYAGSDTPTLALDGTDIYMTKVDEYWVLRKNSPEGNSLGISSYYAYYQGLFFKDYPDIYDAEKFILSTNNSSYQMSSKYVEDNYADNGWYLGYNPEDKYIYQTCTENVDWLFLDVAEAAHYVAEVKLYNALNATDGKGYALDYYESMYTNRAAATTLELTIAAEGLMQGLENAQYAGIFDPLNEYKMMLYYSGDVYDPGYRTKFNDDNIALCVCDAKSASVTAVVETDQAGDLFYSPCYGNDWVSLKVYIDDVLVRTIAPQLLNKMQYDNDRFFDKISAGKHIVRWVFENTQPQENNKYYKCNDVAIRKIGIAKTPLITVNLAEPGSLGTEVLYNVNHVRDVRNLKVIGNMNEEDAVRLSMMTNMMYLDLSDATLAELPEETFSNSNAPYLHDVILPEGMTSIGNKAFYQSNAERIVMPTTVQSIGEYAFKSSMIKSINIPDATTSLERGAFSDCYQLEDVHYSASLTSVPKDCFSDNIFLANINIPEGVTIIENGAFSGCKYGDFQPVLPASLQTIEYSAFYNCQQMKEIVLGDNVSVVGSNAFGYCTGLEKAVVSQNVYFADNSDYNPSEGGCSRIFMGCTALKDLTMRSATVVKIEGVYSQVTDDDVRPNVTLRVPKYLVNYYKLDPYWYNFGDIVGFSTADTKNWTVHADLTLDSHSRFEGEPNLELKNSKFKIVGDLPMTIDNFTTNTVYNSGFDINTTSQVLSGCDYISVIGNAIHNVNMYGRSWLCMTLPFDTKLSNIVPVTDDVLYSIRYYDGAERAENGVGASWKRIYDDDYVIPAGTGFVIQNSAGYNNATIQFKSLENDSRNNVLNNQEFVKELALNTCIDKANSGWNLVGNPYMTYYNIHKLNFTAPITVYDSYKDAYNAYSIADDDYALLPLQGFFVQCPGEEMQTISFPVSGKQFTAEITEQNAARPRVAELSSRKLIDITLSMGDNKDNTRIVFNQAASCGYEINCDASKFMSGNKKNVQLWTLDDEGTAYAINERPIVDGVVALGVTIPSAGSYTFAATRCQAEGVILHDNETGIDTDLTQSEYTFSASEGTFANRFEIRSTSADATGIIDFADSDIEGAKTIYSIEGRLVKKADKFFNVQSLPQGIYIINSNGTSKKVVIK